MSNDNIQTWMIFALVTGSFVAVFLFVLVIYGKLLVRQYTTRKQLAVLDTSQPLGREGVSISTIISTFWVSLFLLIFIVCYIPLLVTSVMTLFGQDGVSKQVMYTIEGFFTPLQGSLSFLTI